MKLSSILRDKGQSVHTVSPDDTLERAVNELVSRNCGALVVVDDGRLAGIISERDVLRACAQLKAPMEAKVADRMTSDVVTASPDDNVEHVMGLMTNHRIRHLPILDGDKLAGVISIGDIVKSQHEELSKENQFLKQYIQS